MIVLNSDIILNEQETKAVHNILCELASIPFSELNKHIGSISISESMELFGKLENLDFYRRNGIVVARPLTEDELMDEYYDRYEC